VSAKSFPTLPDSQRSVGAGTGVGKEQGEGGKNGGILRKLVGGKEEKRKKKAELADSFPAVWPIAGW